MLRLRFLQDRHYAICSLAALGLAAFNIFFRLSREFVTEWDESLYATSAWETLQHGSWIGTTFLGHIDYYNTKPPLIVWLIALSFKIFGPSLWSLRLISATAAWTTVAVLQRWVRHMFGDAVAILTTLILATTFGFLHIHSGRHATTDAMFTLVIVLTVVVLWHARTRERMIVWLGPLLAAAFLVRGMGVLMPLAMVAGTLIVRQRAYPVRWTSLVAAAVLFAVPVLSWGVARYRFDRWDFLHPLVMYDLVARTVGVIEDHPGGPLYYLNILQKHQYDWLAAACIVWSIGRPRLARADTRTPIELVVWAMATIGIPLVMQTKVPSYLNQVYPLFALVVSLIIVQSADAVRHARLRHVAIVCVALTAFGIAEAKLLWYSYQIRDLRHSDQAVLLANRHRLHGHRIFQVRDGHASRFVANAIVGAEMDVTANRASFIEASNTGDFLLTSEGCHGEDVRTVQRVGEFALCERMRPGERVVTR